MDIKDINFYTAKFYNARCLSCKTKMGSLTKWKANKGLVTACDVCISDIKALKTAKLKDKR